MINRLPRNYRLPLIVGTVTLAIAAPLFAQGQMTKREAPPAAAVDANQCVIGGPVDGGWTKLYVIKARAEEAAIDRWQKKVRRQYGPDFTRWKRASRSQGRDLVCESQRINAKNWRCKAKAVPCRSG
ncbi:MAG TPA: hypothetical protein PK680_01975 [Novosphingobium sp.]|nr:hypothetical protein [Novosphingobium sp.]HQA17129.1 hypothetical protein [Novosphingobium sp.]